MCGLGLGQKRTTTKHTGRRTTRRRWVFAFVALLRAAFGHMRSALIVCVRFLPSLHYSWTNYSRYTLAAAYLWPPTHNPKLKKLTFPLRLSVDEDVAVVRYCLPRHGGGARGLLEGAAHDRGCLGGVLLSQKPKERVAAPRPRPRHKERQKKSARQAAQ